MISMPLTFANTVQSIPAPYKAPENSIASIYLQQDSTTSLRTCQRISKWLSNSYCSIWYKHNLVASKKWYKSDDTIIFEQFELHGLATVRQVTNHLKIDYTNESTKDSSSMQFIQNVNNKKSLEPLSKLTKYLVGLSSSIGHYFLDYK